MSESGEERHKKASYSGISKHSLDKPTSSRPQDLNDISAEEKEESVQNIHFERKSLSDPTTDAPKVDDAMTTNHDVDDSKTQPSQLQTKKDVSVEEIKPELSETKDSKLKTGNKMNGRSEKSETSTGKVDDVTTSNRSVDDVKTQKRQFQSNNDVSVEEDEKLELKKSNNNESQESKQNVVPPTTSRDSQAVEQDASIKSLIKDLNIPRLSSFDASAETSNIGNIPRCKSCDLLDHDTSVTVSKFFGLIKSKKSLSNFTEIWLISVPKEDDTFRILNDKTAKEHLSQNFKFHVPTLKIGTLDSLIKLTDELPSLDKFVYDVTQKLANYLKEELQEKGHEFEEAFRVANFSPAEYLIRFFWNFSKFPAWHSNLKISKMLHAKVDEISKCFGRKLNTWGFLQSNLRPFDTKNTSSLQKRYLGDIVKREHFVLDSKFLVTLLVVVPNNKVKEWFNSYHTFCDMVVPNSSEKIFADRNHSLFTVTVAQKHKDTFVDNAREKMFMVRNFMFSEDRLKAEKTHYENLLRVKTRQQAALFRWVQIHFGECFEAWVHVKALMVFVESVIRFGLPVNYQAMLLIPLKSRRKLRKVLDSLYENADSSLAKGYLDKVPGALSSFKVEEYYPYVYFHINLDFIYSKR